MLDKPAFSPDFPVQELIAAFGANLEFQREMAPLTSYQTGGRAKYFLQAETVDDLQRAVQAARKLGLPHFLMGGGSNLLVSDSGYDGLVIRVAVNGLSLVDDGSIEAGAGESLADLITFATEQSLTGLEFAAGIWGSVGGAIYGNAGAYGGEIGKIVCKACLVDAEGKVQSVEPEYFKFDYRHSVLKETREIVVTARFSLGKGDQKEIAARVEDILATRAQRHPDDRTAGCFFKNIPDPSEKHGKLPAGRLLEEVGAKELRVGDARVYEKHANIIVNGGRATSKDIRQLADIMKQKVKDRFGIELQEEVQQLGSFH